MMSMLEKMLDALVEAVVAKIDDEKLERIITKRLESHMVSTDDVDGLGSMIEDKIGDISADDIRGLHRAIEEHIENTDADSISGMSDFIDERIGLIDVDNITGLTDHIRMIVKDMRFTTTVAND